MDRISVRELRQNASRYLARVANGERLEVTDRGHPVALLVPVGSQRWDDLLRRGLLHPPLEDTDLLSEPAVDYGSDASGALAAARSR